MSSLLWGAEEASGESIGSFLPMVRVSVEDDGILIVGVNAKKLQEDMKKALKTSKVSNNMFIEQGWRHVKIHEFFALEMAYILNKIRKLKKTSLGKGVCKDVVDQLHALTWLKNINDTGKIDFDYSQLKRLNVTMLKHQTAFFEYYENAAYKYDLGGALLYGGAGSGKTLAGFGFSLINGSDVTIIAAPKNTIEEVWIETIESRFKKVPKYWTSISKKPITGKEEYLICHYEQLEQVLNSANKFSGKKVTVWLDESHNLSEITSTRTKRFSKIVEEYEAEFVVFASGTPLKAMGREVIPLLRNIDKKFTPETEKAFGKMFGISSTYAADVVAHRLGITTFVVRKDDVVKVEVIKEEVKIDMPTAYNYTLEAVKDKMIAYSEQLEDEFARTDNDNTILFERLLENHEAHVTTASEQSAFRMYKKFAKTLHKGYSSFDHKEELAYCKSYEVNTLLPLVDRSNVKQARQVIARYKYPALVIRGKVLGHVLVKQRIECFSEMAKHADIDVIAKNAKKGVLVFSNYVKVAETVQRSVMDKKIGCELVTGATNKDLPEILKRVGKDKPSQVIAATYASLSTGVPVTVCNVAVFIDEPWRSFVREQAIARVARLGQDSVCYDIGMVLDTGEEPNLSSRGVDIMQWSKQAVNDLLGEVEGNADDLSEDMLVTGLVDAGVASGLVDYIKGLLK